MTFAPTPFVRVTGGVSLSELESLTNSPESQMANAFVTRVGLRPALVPGRDVTSASRRATSCGRRAEALESDLSYQRQLARVRYRYTQRHSTVIGDVCFGGITGDAPLFERFTLGDSSTLRGWNKFDIAPAGGDRVFHGSLEYRYHGIGVFLDSGSVWDHNEDDAVPSVDRLRGADGQRLRHARVSR